MRNALSCISLACLCSVADMNATGRKICKMQRARLLAVRSTLGRAAAGGRNRFLIAVCMPDLFLLSRNRGVSRLRLTHYATPPL